VAKPKEEEAPGKNLDEAIAQTAIIYVHKDHKHRVQAFITK